MRVLASFTGSNREFRAWLAAQMYPDVVSLAEYREKRKTARKRAERKAIITNSSIPDGIA